MKARAEFEARKKLEDEKKAAEEAAAAAEAKKKEAKELEKKIAEEARAKYESEKDKAKDMAPIKFKDAVGRKFSFPFHLCSTWTGMEELIKQAFVHVDVIGPHVQEGHYDLIGPNGEIILPQVWDKVVEPDWTIEMRMWPMDKPPPPVGMRPGMAPMDRMAAHMQGMRGHQQRMGAFPPGMVPPGGRPGGGGGGAVPPPPPPGWQGQRGPPPGATIVNVEPPKTKHRKAQGSMLSWMAGGAKAPKKKTRK
ncbi:hypothetical protein CGRA01v4_03229 [Colletotrichum graminicola]|nr:hypothetical protein CGRA01v4_03229 [Colletotrichum graminicola]